MAVAVPECAHCGQPLVRIKFPNAPTDPGMWVHYRGGRPRCGRTTNTPYAEPKEQQ